MPVVQTGKQGNSSATSLQVTLTDPVASGSGVVLVLNSRHGTATITSVTDDAGNTYTNTGLSSANIDAGSGTPSRAMVFYCPAASCTPGATVVTVTPSESHNMAGRVYEVPGLGPLVDSAGLSLLTDTDGNVIPLDVPGDGVVFGAMVASVTSRVYVAVQPAGFTTPVDDPVTATTNTFLMTSWTDVDAGSYNVEWDRSSGSATAVGVLGAAFAIVPPPPTATYAVSTYTEVDASASTAPTELVETSGHGVTITTVGTDVYRVTHPDPFEEDVVLSLTSTDVGGTDTEVITLAAPVTTGEQLWFVRNESNTGWV